MAKDFDVVDWCESNLTRFIASAGSEWTAECPSCGKWSTFYVNGETGAHVCFSCNIKGRDATGLIVLVEDITWAEAKRWIFKSKIELRRKSDVFSLADRIRALRPTEADEALEPSSVEYELPKGFRPVYRAGKWALPAYLKERRIKSAIARRWGMGFCRHGRYAGRLVIPITCPAGYSFTARDMTGEQEPKYLNPKGADHRRLLIGWDVVRPRREFCIVEGPLDAVRLDQHGIAALAVGGAVLHTEQLAMLFKVPELSAVTVMVDPEERLAPFDIANQLAVHFARIYIARLPDGVDPGSSTSKQATSAMLKAERFTGARMGRTSVRIERSRESTDERFRLGQ